MNKLFRWLLGIAAIVGIVYYSIIKFIVPGYLAQYSAFGVEFS